MKTIGKLRMVQASEIADSGISIGFECLDREIFDPNRCYDKLAAIGVKNARCQTGWARCEKIKGVYDFQWLDNIVENLIDRGINPWFNVGYGNPLYMEATSKNETCVGMVPLYYGEETLLAWQNYIQALAKHYKGRVSHYEIWNEPEGADFWHPKSPDPLEYAKFIKITAAIIKKEIPDAKIGACSMVVFNPEYMIPLFRSGVAKELSFYCVHAYRVQPELNFNEEFSALRRLLDANGGEHVELWQGESGYASYFPENHWLGIHVRVSETNQAKWMLRRFFTDFSCGSKMTSFFQMVDMTDKPYQKAAEELNDPARHGILNGGTYTPKEAYYCLGHIAAILDSETTPCNLYAKLDMTKPFPKAKPISRLADISAITYCFEKNGYPLYVYYVPEDIQMNYPKTEGITLSVLKDDCTHQISDPVLIDMLSGDIYEIESVSEENFATYFMDLPITDYPLIVTDKKVVKKQTTLRQDDEVEI